MKVRRELEEVLMIDILEHLPVRSLLRFRSASKFWCHVIKSSEFINRHLVKQRVNDTVLIVRRTSYDNEEISGPEDMLSFHDMRSEELKEVRPKLSISIMHSVEYIEYSNGEVYLFGPIDGILCMVCDRRVVFCNPVLCEFWETSPCHYTCPDGAYDYLVGQGFGNTDLNEFKVVFIRSVDPSGSPDKPNDEWRKVVHVYNTRTNLWKIIFDGVDFPFMDHHPCSDIFFNGACHWNATSLCEGIGRRDLIVVLNLNTELLTQFEYTSYFKTLVESNPCLMVLNECLSIIWYKEWTIAPVEIWVMKEYGVRESWTKLFQIGPYQAIRVFCYWKNDEWLLAENMKGQLASFAVHTNDVKPFQIYGNERSFRALVYKESLISINSIIGKPYKH